jgi:hypothetical protein
MISKECEERGLKDFKPQEISNVANAFAALGRSPGNALLACMGRASMQLGWRHFGPQEMTVLLNALAKFRSNPGKKMLNDVARECVQRTVRSFDAQAMSIMINAYAVFDHYPGEALLDMICSECTERACSGFKAQDVANLLHGMASLRHHPGKALLDKSVSRCVAMRFEGFNAQNLSNILYAYARLGYKPSEAFLRGFIGRCRVLRWEAFEVLHLTQVFWASMALQVPMDEGLLQAIVGMITAFRAGANGGRKNLDPEEMLALCRAVKQWISLTGGGQLAGLSEETEAVWQQQKHLAEEPRPSGTQQALCEALRKKGYKVLEEQMMWGGTLSLDMIVLPAGDRRVVVEVDGPSHFFVNRPQEPMGHTRLKRRQLDKAKERGELQGWVWVPDSSDESLKRVEEAIRQAK